MAIEWQKIALRVIRPTTLSGQFTFFGLYLSNKLPR